MTTDVAITTNSDIGTFVYISRAVGVPLDTVVKWFILIIVLVFDPLSICLILAYNFLIKREEPKEEIKKFAVYDEKPPIEQVESVEVKSEEEILNRYLDLNGNGIPDWMEPNFDWNNTTLWINNPVAKLYKAQVIDKNR